MSIEFGFVKRYVLEKGFGFVGRRLSETENNDIFFHISSIKRSSPELSNLLISDQWNSNDHFWYEIEVTNKGQQLRSILDYERLKSLPSEATSPYMKILEGLWLDIKKSLPSWLEKATSDLAGEVGLERFKTKRNMLFHEIEVKKEAARIKAMEELKKANEEKEEKLRKLREKEEHENMIKENEFRLLVEEMRPLGFTRSKDVSWYIVNNQLGYKYKHISGVVKMEMDGNTWDFNGGFPQKIYAQLCEELGLHSQHTRAHVVGFDSYKNIYEKSNRT